MIKLPYRNAMQAMVHLETLKAKLMELKHKAESGLPSKEYNTVMGHITRKKRELIATIRYIDKNSVLKKDVKSEAVDDFLGTFQKAAQKERARKAAPERELYRNAELNAREDVRGDYDERKFVGFIQQLRDEDRVKRVLGNEAGSKLLKKLSGNKAAKYVQRSLADEAGIRLLNRLASSPENSSRGFKSTRKGKVPPNIHEESESERAARLALGALNSVGSIMRDAPKTRAALVPLPGMEFAVGSVKYGLMAAPSVANAIAEHPKIAQNITEYKTRQREEAGKANALRLASTFLMREPLAELDRQGKAYDDAKEKLDAMLDAGAQETDDAVIKKRAHLAALDAHTNYYAEKDPKVRAKKRVEKALSMLDPSKRSTARQHWLVRQREAAKFDKLGVGWLHKQAAEERKLKYNERLLERGKAQLVNERGQLLGKTISTSEALSVGYHNAAEALNKEAVAEMARIAIAIKGGAPIKPEDIIHDIERNKMNEQLEAAAAERAQREATGPQAAFARGRGEKVAAELAEIAAKAEALHNGPVVPVATGADPHPEIPAKIRERARKLVAAGHKDAAKKLLASYAKARDVEVPAAVGPKPRGIIPADREKLELHKDDLKRLEKERAEVRKKLKAMPEDRRDAAAKKLNARIKPPRAAKPVQEPFEPALQAPRGRSAAIHARDERLGEERKVLFRKAEKRAKLEAEERQRQVAESVQFAQAQKLRKDKMIGMVMERIGKREDKVARRIGVQVFNKQFGLRTQRVKASKRQQAYVRGKAKRK